VGGVMIIPFSKRHQRAIDKKKLLVSLNKKTRQKILYCLQNHNEFHGWDDSESRLHDDLKKNILEAYGETELKAYINDKRAPVKNIEDFIMGAWPPQVLDAIEIFHDLLGNFENIKDLQNQINFIFQSEETPYRILDNKIIKLDSAFLESEVLSKASDLLENFQFEKALIDFLNARTNFTSCDYSGTVFECNNAIESALKKALDKTKGDQGELKKQLMKSGLIPDYFQGFCDHFEGLLQSCFTITNESARHGKKEVPISVNKIDHAVASFVLHLTGTLLVFIMERYKEKQPEPQEIQEIPDDDVPF
jgi:hypothetical protein